jgi:two-component system, cell cycle sensor histidine kinase and response regulator CckA
MKDEEKTKKQLIQELKLLRRSVAELQEAEGEYERTIEGTSASEPLVKESTEFVSELGSRTSLAKDNGNPHEPDRIDRALPGVGNKHIFWLATGDYSRILCVSPSYERVWQRSRETLLEHPLDFLEAIHPEDRREVLENLERQKRGQLTEKTYRILRPDGSIRLIMDCAFPIVEQNGTVSRIAGIAEDITERKQAEKALRKSEERYRALLQNAPAMVYRMLLPEGTYEYMSDAATMISGFSPEEWLNTPLLIKERIHPEFADYFRKEWQSLIPGDMPPFYEYKFIHKSGEVRWLHQVNTLIRDQDGKPVAIEGIVTDVTEQKMAEEALRESETRYRLLAENTSDTIWTMRLDGTFTYHSQAVEKLRGYLPEEANRIPLDESLTPSSHSLAQHIIDEESVKPETEHWADRVLELEVYRRDGSTVWTEASVRALRDSEGKVIGIQGSTRDISKRKRAEEVLRESEERYRTMLDQAADIILVHDETGQIMDVNQKACRSLGYSREELLSKSIGDIDPEAIRAGKHELWGKILAGEHFTFESRHVRKDGSAIPVEVALGPVRLPLGVAVIGIVRDMTDRKRAEDALRESEARFSTVFHASPLSIAMTRLADNQVVDVNKTWQDLTGFTREEAIGRTPMGLNIWADFRERDRLIRMLHKQGTVTGFEMQMRQKSGAIRHLIMSLELVELSGEPLLLSMAVDITDRKQMEEEKAKLATQYLQLQKTESLGRMAGAIAHHFNNQLGIVIGFLDLAMIDQPQESQSHANITVALKASRRAAEVSSLMLTYLGQTPGERKPVDLSEVCRWSLSMLLAAMPKNVTLETDLPSFGPAITANANQIQQVLTNLITNAWEAFGESRGAIHLTVKAVSQADIATANRFPVDWQPQDIAYACLEVADTGCGIADKDIARLFDPFFSSKFTGRGLGLSVVLGILRGHDGVITVESEPGRGSVFRVFVPMSVEETTRQLDKVAKTTEMEGGGTVLLVEDEETMRNVAATLLMHLGFTVFTAKDGVEAVEVFLQHQDEIRCVLCDLTMPRMNGWETLAALRALRPDIPVVLTSGYNEAKVMEGKRAELPQAFLHKPYTMAELKVALGVALGASSAERVRPN